VSKALSGCDEIIRQHKSACLRVTALLACKDMLWCGTSAGVVLTAQLPYVSSATVKIAAKVTLMANPHGHSGHVRFLTSVETSSERPTPFRFGKKGASSVEVTANANSQGEFFTLPMCCTSCNHVFQACPTRLASWSSPAATATRTTRAVRPAT